MVWIPLFLDPSDGVFGRFDLAALCGCRTLNFCLFVLYTHNTANWCNSCLFTCQRAACCSENSSRTVLCQTARFHGGARWNSFWRKVRPSGIPQEIPPGLRFPTPAEARSPPSSKSEGQQRVAFHMKILYGHMLPCPCAGQRCSTAHLYHTWPGHGLRQEPPRASAPYRHVSKFV